MTPHLAHDSGLDDGETALGHHLHQIAIAESEAQIPSDALDDELTVEVTPHKQFCQSQKPSHCPAFRSSVRLTEKARSVWTRAPHAAYNLSQ